MIITIDGPAGSGKSTTARLIAKRLGGSFLDTGAMYRSVTLKALRARVDLGDKAAVAEIARSCSISFQPEATGGQRVLLDEHDVTNQIRSQPVNDWVSIVSAVAEVREVMVSLQQQIGEEADRRGEVLVAEGRDMGTVVFPRAQVKAFLTASEKERALRRYRDLREGERQRITIEEVERSVARRDELDSSRAVGPLLKAEDATAIETTDLRPDEVVERILQLYEQRRPAV